MDESVLLVGSLAYDTVTSPAGSVENELGGSATYGGLAASFHSRISNGGFVIDRARYDLYQENGVHLHGGKEGFHQKYWNIDEVDHSDKPFVKLTYNSKHLEEGYPGNLTVSVTYKLMNNALFLKSLPT